MLDYVVKRLLEYVKIVRKNVMNLRKNVKAVELIRKFYVFVFSFKKDDFMVVTRELEMAWKKSGKNCFGKSPEIEMEN